MAAMAGEPALPAAEPPPPELLHLGRLLFLTPELGLGEGSDFDAACMIPDSILAPAPELGLGEGSDFDPAETSVLMRPCVFFRFQDPRLRRSSQGMDEFLLEDEEVHAQNFQKLQSPNGCTVASAAADETLRFCIGTPEVAKLAPKASQ